MRFGQLRTTLARFSEVWAVDFEFNAGSGERPVPICCVAKELRSGREQTRWGEELRTPIVIPASGVMVAYYASAEIGCYLALGWPMPSAVLDLFAEFRVFANGRGPAAGVAGASLLDALSFFGLRALDPDEKARWRERILAGPPYEEADREGILDYCRSDVLALQALIEPLTRHLGSRPHWEEHAILRGRAMIATAMMEHTGIPLDIETLQAISASWSEIQGQLIASAQAGYPFYEKGALRLAMLETWAAEQGIVWPRTAAGRLSLAEDTLRMLSRAYPQLAPFRELRSNLGKLQVSKIAVGQDGRNRTLLSPFRARTGRYQPSGSKFVFAPSVWIRHLIRPQPGHALAYIDFASQEIGIAAALSGDPVMQQAYTSGDPYLSFAVDAGLAPPEATKDSHKAVRERCKALVLGTLYGMGEATLANHLSIPVPEARRLLEAHKRTYVVFWDWIRRVADSATLKGYTDSVFGWRLHITADTRPTSLLNHPMQSHGAEILRLACCFLTEAGLSVCAPVHDAVLIEAEDTSIDAVVDRARAMMSRASRIVLGGFEIRTDARIVRYPDRFEDPRGAGMWQKVTAILADIQSRSAAENSECQQTVEGVTDTHACHGRSHARIGTPAPVPFSL